MSRVAVLKGGRSLERQVSLRSGARVTDALERLGHDVVAIDVGPDLVDRLREARPDVAFIALHGRDGEDGTVQELLELVGVPYTGSGISACIRSFDKVARQARRSATPASRPPTSSPSPRRPSRQLGAAEALPEIEERLDFPIVVKPAGQGSALGIKFADSAGAVPAALLAAFSYDDKVLLERFVPRPGPRRSRCSTARRCRSSRPSRVGERYDFEARYEIGQTDFVCPARAARTASPSVRRSSRSRVWDVLGLRGMARVDVMLSEETGELYVLEANAIPGLTDISLLPQAAEAAGISFDALIQRLLDLAL